MLSRGRQCAEIITSRLDRFPPTPGKRVYLQDAKAPSANEDVLDIPIRCSPIEDASSSHESASRKIAKRKASRELFWEDSDSN